jgi:hypothetical protein
MDSDKLHLAASAYANMRKALFEEASEKSPGPPRILACPLRRLQERVRGRTAGAPG